MLHHSVDPRRYSRYSEGYKLAFIGLDQRSNRGKFIISVHTGGAPSVFLTSALSCQGLVNKDLSQKISIINSLK